MKHIPHRELAKSRKGNAFIKWGNFGVENTDEKLACVRLKENVFIAGGQPKFKLSKNDTFFTIGSCFARGLESILLSRKLNVASHTDGFLKWRTVNETVTPLGATNRYNTGSIVNEFRWHINPDYQFSDELFLKIGDDLYTDPHMNPTLAPASVLELRERRAIWKTIFDRLNNVNVVIITLGLVEVWYDHYMNTVLNSAPDPRAVRADRDRFSFSKLGFKDNFDNLTEVLSLLKSICPLNFRLIITVSPVPLMRTFTAQDIVIANQYSKNCLRTVAQEFADEHENVDYFPSYEIAINSNPENTWEPSDRRHVRGDFSKEIMKQFFKMYFEDLNFDDSAEYGIKRLF